jgi:HEAT repeat protein
VLSTTEPEFDKIKIMKSFTRSLIFVSSLSRVTWSLALGTALLAAASFTAIAAEGSAEKARQAIAVIQSAAPPAEKALACKHLAIYGTPEAVPVLAPLLTDAELSSWARIALEVIPGTAADAALREALGKAQGRQLVGVLNSIGVRGDAQAVAAVAAKLSDANPEVASAAAVALGRIGGDAAIKALQPALASTSGATRSAVAQGCILAAEKLLADGKNAEAAKLYDTVRATDLPKQRILEATRGAILARQDAGLPLLLETLRSPDKAVFAIGLSAARELPGRAVTDALAAELNRIGADRQGPLLLALAERSDAAALPAVFAATRSESKSLRMVAIEVMARTRNAACVPVLLEALAESDVEAATAARAALLRMPSRMVDDQLADRLKQTSGGKRRALLELAGQRGVTAAVPEMVRASTDSDPAIRAAAIKALGLTVNADDLGALIGLLANAKSAAEFAPVEAALEAACTRIPEKAACADKLLAALSTSAVPAKCALLRVLPAASTPQGLAAVQAALTSPDVAVRDAALRVLADWPDAPALPVLLGVLRSTQDETQRFFALRGAVRLLGLGGLSVQETLKNYADLLAGAKKADDRKVILSGLGNVADPAALRMLEPLLTETPIQTEAEAAMLTIATAIMGPSPTEAKAVATKLQTQSKSAITQERATKLLAQMEKVGDFITAWQVSGPYTKAAKESTLFATAFPPEKPAGKAVWRPLPACTKASAPGMLDLFAALGGESRIGYARTWVHSGQAQRVRVEFGTDDGHKLWLNGKLISEANRGGAAVAGDFKVDAELRSGWNLLLLKVTQDTGPWEFCLRIRTPAGDRLEGLRTQETPPAE